jgi:hypothetical protein
MFDLFFKRVFNDFQKKQHNALNELKELKEKVD